MLKLVQASAIIDTALAQAREQNVAPHRKSGAETGSIHGARGSACQPKGWYPPLFGVRIQWRLASCKALSVRVNGSSALTQARQTSVRPMPMRGPRYLGRLDQSWALVASQPANRRPFVHRTRSSVAKPGTTSSLPFRGRVVDSRAVRPRRRRPLQKRRGHGRITLRYSRRDRRRG